MNTLLMWLAGLLVAILAALFAVPHFIDWNVHRGVFETQASRILGRDVRVGGEVNVRFLPTPYVRFERVRISEGNEAGFGGRSFFRAESFTMWLSVPPLLKGVLEAHEVELQRPSLRLALDGAGRGNWRTFKVQSGTLPFVPAGVSLQSVNITDGLLTFDSADGEERVRIDGVNGELSAESLGGPFKFDGTAKWRGGLRDVKFSTFESPRSESDAVPVWLQIKPQTTRNSYVLEGKFRNLSKVPEFAGDLKADIALTGVAPAKEKTPTGPSARPHVALTAKIAGAGTRFDIKNLVASFEDVGPPQIVTGDATVKYGSDRDLKLALVSRWLDLDRLSGTPDEGRDDPSPMGLVGSIVPEIVNALPAQFTTDAQLTVEQVQLSGEAVSGVRVAINQEKGALELRNLSAGLPGGAQLKLSGKFERGAVPDVAIANPGAAKFAGNLFIGGPSMVRTVRWATQAKEGAQDFSDGAFAFAGNVSLSTTEVALTKVKAEYAGRPVNGALLWRNGPVKTLDVRLEGHEIDARWFGIEKITLATFRNWLGDSGAPVKVAVGDASPGSTGKDNGSDAAVVSGGTPTPSGGQFLSRFAERAVVRFKAGRFNNGPDVLRDVDVDFRFSDNALKIESMKFQTGVGLDVAVDGTLTNADQTPNGQLNWQVAASGPAGVAQLARLLDLDQETSGAGRIVDTLSKLAPLDVAGTVLVGQRQKGTLDILADGMARDGRTTLTAQLDGGADGWRTAPIDVTLDIENAKLTHVLGLLVGNAGPDSTALKRTGKASIKAVGTASEKLLTAVNILSDGFNASFSGHLAVGESEIERAEGQLELDTQDLREVLQIAGLRLGGGASGVSAVGKLTLARDEGAWVYWPETLKIGGQKVTGSLALLQDPSGGPGISVGGKLSVVSASLSGLLAPLMQTPAIVPGSESEAAPELVASSEPTNGSYKSRKNAKKRQREAAAAAAAAEAAAIAAAKQPVFSDQVFEFAAVGPVTGDLDVRFGALTMAPGLVLNDVNMSLAFRPDNVVLEKLTGSAGGGQVLAKAKLAKARAGVTLSGEIQLENSNLADLIPSTTKQKSGDAGPAEKARVSGTMSLKASASGQALSLRGLVASLQGKGQAKIDEVVIRGLSPGAVTSAANAAVVEDKALGGEELVSALRRQLEKGEAIIPASRIPLKVVDGSLRFAAFRASGRAGSLRNVTTIDLSTLNVDSAWQVKPGKSKKSAGSTKASAPWPEINVVFVGPLANLGKLSPQISAGKLERELAVRRIQRSVDELESLRREDEQRAAEERDRRRQRELERARAAEREDAVESAPLEDIDGVPTANIPELDGDADGGDNQVLQDSAPTVEPKPVRRRVKRRYRKKKISPWSADIQRRYLQQTPGQF